VLILNFRIDPENKLCILDGISTNLTRQTKEKIMNVDQHLKVASWHIEQARLHATVEEGHKCGCPLNDDYAKIIDQVESGNIVDEGH
jgi:hypothetical protein